MRKSNRDYIIPFAGLKLGFHDFEFEISDAFFEDLEYSIIHSGSVHVDLKLEKKEIMLLADFSFSGKVFTSCDRCNDPIEVPVSGEYRYIYKFGTGESDDESLIIISPDAFELDVREQIYEMITVSLPARCVHPEGECNPEVLEVLKQYELTEDELPEDDDEDTEWDDPEDEGDDDPDTDPDDNIDPRWSILKNLN